MVVNYFNFLATTANNFIDNEAIDEKRQNCQNFFEALWNLNTKHPQGSPRPEHIRTVMEKMYDDTDPIHDMMAQFFQIGGSMYVMSIQYLMARDVMCHPEEYADKIVATDRIINEFKEARSVPALLQMLTITCAHATPSQAASQSRPNRSLLDELRRAAPSSLPTPSISRLPCTSSSTEQTIQANSKLRSLKRALAKTQTSSSENSSFSSSEGESSSEDEAAAKQQKRAPSPVKNPKQKEPIAKNVLTRMSLFIPMTFL